MADKGDDARGMMRTGYSEYSSIGFARTFVGGGARRVCMCVCVCVCFFLRRGLQLFVDLLR